MAIRAEEKLNPEALAFLSLLRSALRGEAGEAPDGVDWNAVFSLAKQHRVMPMILESAYRCPGIPEELLARAGAEAMSSVIRQTVQTSVFLALYGKLRAAGICPAVMKGIVCRQLYPKPDLRPSGDEDLLIEPAMLSEVHAALLANGMSADRTPRDPEPVHEITYTNANQIRIELHTSLFPPDSEAYGDLNELFDGALDRAIEVRIGGESLRTLSPTDHLLYLICHFYKHFLHSGVGIRQLCDIGLFSEKVGPEIDWAHVRDACERLGLVTFVGALYRIGEKYLGLPAPLAFADSGTDETPLLKDILASGVYGGSSMDRLHSSTLTLDAVAARKRGKRTSGPLASLFPPLRSMREKFPWLNKHPWLLPAAWAQRILRYLLHRDGLAPSDPAETLRIGRERVELLKAYDLLK